MAVPRQIHGGPTTRVLLLAASLLALPCDGYVARLLPPAGLLVRRSPPLVAATPESLYDLLGMTAKEWGRVESRVPEAAQCVEEADESWPSLVKLQARLGITAKELKGMVLRLPQLVGLDFELEVSPSLTTAQQRLALSDAELSALVRKLPQMLGQDVTSNVEALEEKLGGAAAAKAEAIRNPSALNVAVRGHFRTQRDQS